MIHIIEHFIDSSRVEALLAFCQGLRNDQFGGRDFWKGRVVTFDQETAEVKALAEAVTRKIRKSIYDHTGEKLYPDCRNFARWRVGEGMGLHADGDYPDGSFHWRKYGAILYLNDDFGGGEIHFPNQELKLKPKPGTLVFFPGCLPYLHGVHEVTSGVRYNMASFWTDDQARSVMEFQDD